MISEFKKGKPLLLNDAFVLALTAMTHLRKFKKQLPFFINDLESSNLTSKSQRKCPRLLFLSHFLRLNYV